MDWRLLVCLIFLAHLRVLRGIFFFFDYPRVDIFSFTKIGKPVYTGWIFMSGFCLCAADERSGLRAIFQIICASWSLPNQNDCNNETS